MPSLIKSTALSSNNRPAPEGAGALGQRAEDAAPAAGGYGLGGRVPAPPSGGGLGGWRVGAGAARGECGLGGWRVGAGTAGHHGMMGSNSRRLRMESTPRWGITLPLR